MFVLCRLPFTPIPKNPTHQLRAAATPSPAFCAPACDYWTTNAMCCVVDLGAAWSTLRRSETGLLHPPAHSSAVCLDLRFLTVQSGRTPEHRTRSCNGRSAADPPRLRRSRLPQCLRSSGSHGSLFSLLAMAPHTTIHFTPPLHEFGTEG